MNKRKEIRDKIINILTESGGVGALTVESNRMIPFQDDVLPAINVRNLDETWETRSSRGSEYVVMGFIGLAIVALGKQPPEVLGVGETKGDDQVDEISSNIELVLLGDTLNQALEGVVTNFFATSFDYGLDGAEKEYTKTRVGGVFILQYRYLTTFSNA